MTKHGVLWVQENGPKLIHPRFEDKSSQSSEFTFQDAPDQNQDNTRWLMGMSSIGSSDRGSDAATKHARNDVTED
jgi:hypothetical protein